jgi:DNA-binding CsgD family transcriptional regulator/tetratricopeptide (TPR) repeat protein
VARTPAAAHLMGTLGPVLAGRSGLSPVMVGRAAALARLQSLVPTSPGSPSAVAMISGEAGIGKTRLLRELFASRTGLRIVAGQADSGSFGRPFDVVASALDGGLPPMDDRQRGGADLLLAAAGPGPAVLVFEDLHWCDAESAAVFERLALLERPGLVLLGTYRPDDLDRRLPGADLLLRLERRRTVHHVALDRLDRAGVNAMLSAIYGRAVPSHVIDALEQRTGGNPFFIEELVVAAGDHEPEHLTRQPLPWTLAEVVRGQLDGLDPLARSVVDAAAVLGPSASFDVLATVTRLTESELVGQLRDLVRRGLLVEPAADVFAFRHALVRDAVEQALLGRERRRLHEAALVTLQEAACPDLVALAHHAAGAGRWEAMVELGRRGARDAMEMGSTFQALRLATDALGEAPDDLELLAIAGRAAWMVGLYEESLGITTRWVAAARAAGDAVNQSRAAQHLVRLLWDLGRGEEHERALAEAEALIDRMPPGEDHARAVTAAAQAHMLTSRSDALEWTERAVAAAEAVGARAVRAQALVERASVLADDQERLEEARAAFEEAFAEAEAVGDLVALTRGLNNIIKIVPVSTAAGREVIERMRRVAEKAGFDSMAKLRYHNWIAEVAQFDGDQEAALASLDLALTSSEGTSWGSTALLKAQILAEAGALAEAEALLEHVGPVPCDDSAWIDRVRLELAAARGDSNQARHVLTLIGANSVRFFDKPHHREFLIDCVDAGLRAGVTPSDIRSAFTREFGAEHAAEGYLLLAEGDADAGAERLLAALAPGVDDLPCPVRATIAIRVAAALLSAGDDARARALLDDATVLLARWPGWRAAQLAELRSELADAVPLAPVGRDGFPLTSREQEVATLIAAGLTNAQLARRLHIAPKTAAAHVSNILTKLGMVSRSEVAAWAARHGLADAS